MNLSPAVVISGGLIFFFGIFYIKHTITSTTLDQKELDSMKAPTGSQLAPLLMLAVLGTAQSFRQNNDWQFTWSCENGKCLRSNSSRAGSSASIFTCSLTCGRYSSLLPRPTGNVALGRVLVRVNPARITFSLSQLAAGQDEAEQMTNIFRDNLAKECPGDITTDPGTSVLVSLQTSSPDLTLNLDTDETYSLDVAYDNSQVTVSIRATTLYGARHGLETLSQLISCPAIAGEPLVMLAKANITDGPAYPHRGLLIDTARHYLTEDTIKRTIDAMAASKLNVFHWHATDSQSFPLQLPRVPQLARFGAYSPEKVYTVETLTRVIDYARLRGIRVLIEIDAPSHSGNGWQWGESAGLGSLAVCVNQQPWRNYCIQPPCGQLNPTNSNVYRVLRELYADLLAVMAPNEILHMGGDELHMGCWNSTDEIVNWMAARGLGRTEEDFLKLWANFQSAALKIVDEERGHSNTPTILWTSHLTQTNYIEKYLDKNRYIIQTWVEAKNTLPSELLDKGYRLIISTKDAWYLDHGFWGSTAYHNWRVAYGNVIPREKGVLGGEVAMWSEYVDSSTLDGKIWPRAAAAAERLWSDPKTSANSAEHRMYLHRERLVRRGIGADPLAPEWCFLNEGQC